ncbi:MAG: hypothetical protein AB1705_13050 [Verrucomicrobiota bacterium]
MSATTIKPTFDGMNAKQLAEIAIRNARESIAAAEETYARAKAMGIHRRRAPRLCKQLAKSLRAQLPYWEAVRDGRAE